MAIQGSDLSSEIYDAFSDVTRKGGVSWSETVVMDMYGSKEDREASSRADQDALWSELIDEPNWCPDREVGGWSFLDAIGFRYYLPAAMIRCLDVGCDVGIARHLVLTEPWTLTSPNRKLTEAAYYANRSREHRLEQWSALDPRQRTCIKTFLLAMVEIDRNEQLDGSNEWEDALLSYWLEVDYRTETTNQS